ncbi:MAG: DUF4336 domain-containing protein [Solirubrobacterales bacterium]
MQAHEPRGLREIDDELWVAEDGLRYVVEMGRRMTVIRLPSGELFVHSPMPLDDELRRQLAELGAVRFVLPASNLHGHLTMGDYRDAYPDSQLFAVAGLAAKGSDLRRRAVRRRCFERLGVNLQHLQLSAPGDAFHAESAPVAAARLAVRSAGGARTQPGVELGASPN